MGLLHGFTFAAFYAVMGLPIARVIDRGNRPPTIAAGIAVWSVATAAGGLATDYGIWWPRAPASPSARPC